MVVLHHRQGDLEEDLDRRCRLVQDYCLLMVLLFLLRTFLLLKDHLLLLSPLFEEEEEEEMQNLYGKA